MEYNYTAINSDGKRIEGTREAESRDSVVNFLSSQGMTIVSVTEKIGFDFNNLLSTDIGGVPLAEKVILTKQLSTMISAGIPLIQAMDILVQQTEKESLKEKLKDVYAALESGQKLSDGFRRQEGIFSEVQLNLIEAGEESGNLNEMLLKVAEDMEESKNLRGKITGALIYPAIIFLVLIAVLAVMIIFMIPQIEALYESFDEDLELPLITQVFVYIGNAFSNIFTLGIIIFSIVGIYLGYRSYYSTPGGRITIDRYKLKIPVFGKLIQKVELVQFTRILAMLMKSGIPIIDAIRITSNALDNQTFKVTVSAAVDGITKGETLSVALAKNNKYDALPLILLRMIATGEESGQLDKVLEDVSGFYNAEVKQATDNLTKAMEPFILVVVGVLVALLAVAIYYPVYQIMQAVQ